VVNDWMSGYQGLAAKMTGGLRTIAGVVTDVDPAAPALLSLPKAFHPNAVSSFLAVVVPAAGTQALQSATVDIQPSGALTITADMPHTAMVGIAVSFAPLEVKLSKKLTLEDTWSVTSHSATLHKLPMGGSTTLCALSGSVQRQWSTSPTKLSKGGHLSVVAELDAVCTAAYKAGFWMVANIQVDGVQQHLKSEQKLDFQLSLTEGNKLALWVRQGKLRENQKVVLSLDGVTLGAGTIPPPCGLESWKMGAWWSSKVERLSEALHGEAELESATAWQTKEGKFCEGNWKKDWKARTVKSLSECQASCAASSTCKSITVGTYKGVANICVLCTSEVFGNAGWTTSYTAEVSCKVTGLPVNTTQQPGEGFPIQGIVGLSSMLVMGDDIQGRTCVLHGVARFGSIDGSAPIAQLDPNLKDQRNGASIALCAPLSTQLFFGGLVTDSSAPITQSVALQIEPHGRMRIIAGLSPNEMKSESLDIRLDGITYQTYLPFNQPHACVTYCFPLVATIEQLESAGCTKTCTPSQYERKADGSVAQLNCRCDMVKRLDCWKHDKENAVRCGQFKQLMRSYVQDPKLPPHNAAKCSAACARQLAGL